MDVSKLTRKMGWTGWELGKLEVTNMAVMFKAALEGKDPTPLIDRETFQKMLQSLTDSRQLAVYNGFIGLHDWLSLKYNVSQTCIQQAQLQYRTIWGFISQAIMTETFHHYQSVLPLIVTQKQYFALMDKERSEQEDNNAIPAFELLRWATKYYCQLLREGSRKKNPLRAVKKRYAKEKISDPRLLEIYEPDTTKWELIDTGDVFDCYDQDSMDSFIHEFSDLANDVGEDIIVRCHVNIMDYPVSEWMTSGPPPQNLVDANVYNIKEELRSPHRVFQDEPRALKNGVAVIAPIEGLGESSSITQSGFFVEPDLDATPISLYSLPAFFPEAETFAEYDSIFTTAKDTFVDSLYILRGYNTAIDLIVETYDLPDLDVFKADIDHLVELMESCNKMTVLLQNKVQETEQFDGAPLHRKKVQVLENYFQPIDCSAVVTPQEKVAQARPYLEGFRAFTTDVSDAFFLTLCKREPSEGL